MTNLITGYYVIRLKTNLLSFIFLDLPIYIYTYNEKKVIIYIYAYIPPRDNSIPM